MAVLVIASFAGGIVIGSAELYNPPASEPDEFIDRLGDAGLACVDVATLVVDRDRKTVSCGTQHSGTLTLETWGRRPSEADWLAERCALLARYGKTERGALVAFPEGMIRVAQGPISVERDSPSSPEVIGARLASIFGGASVTYECPRRPGT